MKILWKMELGVRYLCCTRFSFFLKLFNHNRCFYWWDFNFYNNKKKPRSSSWKSRLEPTKPPRKSEYGSSEVFSFFPSPVPSSLRGIPYSHLKGRQYVRNFFKVLLLLSHVDVHKHRLSLTIRWDASLFSFIKNCWLNLCS